MPRRKSAIPLTVSRDPVISKAPQFKPISNDTRPPKGLDLTRKLGIFISYSHSDQVIANALVQSLSQINENLNVLIDHELLQAGDRYEQRLAENIHDADVFMMICRGRLSAVAGSGDGPPKDMNYCFYEAGQFRNKLLAQGQVQRDQTKGDASLSRLLYLYDDERPRAMSQFQGAKVTSLDRNNTALSTKLPPSGADLNSFYSPFENTEIYGLLKSLTNRDLGNPTHRRILLQATHHVILAYTDGKGSEIIAERVLLPRIHFSIMPKPQDNPERTLSDDTEVCADEQTLEQLFGLVEKTANWGRIKSHLTDMAGSLPLWILNLEAAVADAMRGVTPVQSEQMHQKESLFYRPVLARYVMYANESKRFYISFTPARAKTFDMRVSISLLLVSLILSIRFRQQVLSMMDEFANLHKAAAERDVDFVTNATQAIFGFERAILGIETEYAELGGRVRRNCRDSSDLTHLIRNPGRRQRFEAASRKWIIDRGNIFVKIKALHDIPHIESVIGQLDYGGSREARNIAAELVDSIQKLLAELRPVNKEFIVGLTAELLDHESLRDESEATQ